ncbi:hypothetical protein BC832DRAFT_277740 [Gaertneriomyces semiglobifer]|nr:hypothetical protein BC832DRAFT_277740 [Gaertneriomyces semiglobifer]
MISQHLYGVDASPPTSETRTSLPIAKTPRPPYYAVIFTSVRHPSHSPSVYSATASAMADLAARQPGYLGAESSYDQTNRVGITVSFWESEEAIREWKQQVDHLAAQKMGKQAFYKMYRVRVAKVEREYGWDTMTVADEQQPDP